MIDQIESVQKERKTNKCTKKRELLQKLKLPTIAYRRIRGDLIEAYKIVHKKYHSDVCNVLKLMTD